MIKLFSVKYQLVLFSSALLFSTYALADCKCPKGKSTDEAYKGSDVVFLGQVISVAKANILREGFKEVKLILTVPYKGTEILPATEYVTVYTEEGPCGVEFIRQNDYLVFAKGAPAFLKTSTCDLTDIQESSREKQGRVDKLSKGG